MPLYRCEAAVFLYGTLRREGEEISLSEEAARYYVMSGALMPLGTSPDAEDARSAPRRSRPSSPPRRRSVGSANDPDMARG